MRAVVAAIAAAAATGCRSNVCARAAVNLERRRASSFDTLGVLFNFYGYTQAARRPYEFSRCVGARIEFRVGTRERSLAFEPSSDRRFRRIKFQVKILPPKSCNAPFSGYIRDFRFRSSLNVACASFVLMSVSCRRTSKLAENADCARARSSIRGQVATAAPPPPLRPPQTANFRVIVSRSSRVTIVATFNFANASATQKPLVRFRVNYTPPANTSKCSVETKPRFLRG